MGKALVLPNCDFSANKVTTINFAEIHCTGISIPATASVKEGLSTTLTLTLTPTNTTDIVTWSSSDTEIATVANGTVTGVSEGSATITATCNGHTATCIMTVTSKKLFTKGGMPVVNVTQNNEFLDYAKTSTNATQFIAFGASDGALPVFGLSTYIANEWAANLYPFKIPEGTTQITVNCPDLAPIIVYYNSEEASYDDRAGTSKVRASAKALNGETPAAGTDWSISGWVYDTRTFVIPETEGIDSFTLGFRAQSTAVFDTFDPDTVSITFA